MFQKQYSAHYNLPDFGISGQTKLQASRVVIVGMGGLGCPAAMYLAASGIGTIGLIDFDTVSISNLARQVLYGANDIGKKKVFLAEKRLKNQYPEINFITHNVMLTAKNAAAILQDYDLIIDGTDNFQSKYLLNDTSLALHKPLIYGAIHQYEGQVAVFNALLPNGERSGQYRDIFPEVREEMESCAAVGVLSPLCGIIANIQVSEALKILSGIGAALTNRIYQIDVRTMQSRIIEYNPL